MSEVFPIDIRPANEGDEAVIFSTWLKSYRYGADPPVGVEDAVYFPFHREVLLAIIERDTTRIAVATPPGDPGTVLGYAVGEPRMRQGQALHYVYVKPAFRRLRVMDRLLARLEVDLRQRGWYTHRTKAVLQLAASARWPRFLYNPYLR